MRDGAPRPARAPELAARLTDAITYMLQVMEGGDPVLAMRVIVGKPDTPTPLFSDEMTSIVFSPFTDDPYGIDRVHAQLMDSNRSS